MDVNTRNTAGVEVRRSLLIRSCAVAFTTTIHIFQQATYPRSEPWSWGADWVWTGAFRKYMGKEPTLPAFADPQHHNSFNGYTL